MTFINKFIDKVKISIFKVNRYNELIIEKLSSAIIYGLLLSITLGFLIGIYDSYEFRQTKNEMVSILEKEDNKFILENGVLNFEKSPMKYEKGKFIVYIDTSKSKNEISSLRSILIHKDYSIAILKDGIVMDLNEYSQELTFINDENIFKNQDLINTINKFGFLGNFIFIINIIGIFISMIIDTLLLSIFAQLVSRLENIKISYKDIFKICIHAITFTTILSKITYLSSLGFLINGVYVIIIIKSIRKNYLI
jgi:Protein of unknown function (DUF1189)